MGNLLFIETGQQEKAQQVSIQIQRKGHNLSKKRKGHMQIYKYKEKGIFYFLFLVTRKGHLHV